MARKAKLKHPDKESVKSNQTTPHTQPKNKLNIPVFKIKSSPTAKQFSVRTKITPKQSVSACSTLLNPINQAILLNSLPSSFKPSTSTYLSLSQTPSCSYMDFSQENNTGRRNKRNFDQTFAEPATPLTSKTKTIVHVGKGKSSTSAKIKAKRSKIITSPQGKTTKVDDQPPTPSLDDDNSEWNHVGGRRNKRNQLSPASEQDNAKCQRKDSSISPNPYPLTPHSPPTTANAVTTPHTATQQDKIATGNTPHDRSPLAGQPITPSRQLNEDRHTSNNGGQPNLSSTANCGNDMTNIRPQKRTLHGLQIVITSQGDNSLTAVGYAKGKPELFRKTICSTLGIKVEQIERETVVSSLGKVFMTLDGENQNIAARLQENPITIKVQTNVALIVNLKSFAYVIKGIDTTTDLHELKQSVDKLNNIHALKMRFMGKPNTIKHKKRAAVYFETQAKTPASTISYQACALRGEWGRKRTATLHSYDQNRHVARSIQTTQDGATPSNGTPSEHPTLTQHQSSTHPKQTTHTAKSSLQEQPKAPPTGTSQETGITTTTTLSKENSSLNSQNTNTYQNPLPAAKNRAPKITDKTGSNKQTMPQTTQSHRAGNVQQQQQHHEQHPHQQQHPHHPDHQQHTKHHHQQHHPHQQQQQHPHHHQHHHSNHIHQQQRQHHDHHHQQPPPPHRPSMPIFDLPEADKDRFIGQLLDRLAQQSVQMDHLQQQVNKLLFHFERSNTKWAGSRSCGNHEPTHW